MALLAAPGWELSHSELRQRFERDYKGPAPEAGPDYGRGIATLEALRAIQVASARVRLVEWVTTRPLPAASKLLQILALWQAILPERASRSRIGILDMVRSTFTRVRYLLPSLDSNAARWPTHPLWLAAEAHMREAIEEHAFAPASPRNDLPTPRLIKLEELRRQLIGLAASCGALEGLPDARAGDLPGLAAAAMRDAERERPGLLEEKLARARARYGVFG